MTSTGQGFGPVFSKSSIGAGRDVRITNTHNHYGANTPPEPDPVLILRTHAALGALHDSAERPDPPKCHPETREAILSRIDQWSKDTANDAKPILWLTGAAGAGKTAIAQSLVERWIEQGVVTSSFFFWRTSPSRNHKTHLIPTLAFQIARSLPDTKEKLQEAVKDESVFARSLRAQIQGLVVDALEDILEIGKPVTIVIDGLDECCTSLPRKGGFPGQDHEQQQHEILEALAYACQRQPLLRALIASRPEHQIRISFNEEPLNKLSIPVTLIDEPNASADITLYLECKFAEIRNRNRGISSSWPSKDQIRQLVQKSSGQFIYPSTVVKYVARRRQFPVKSLQQVLELRSGSTDQQEHPLADLNALYTLVLHSVSPDSLPIVKTILGCMCYLGAEKTPHIFLGREPGLYPLYLESFLLLSPGELSFHLTDLHSVLSIPSDEEAMDSEAATHKPIRFMHATLSEYLQDPHRSGDFHISESDTYLSCSLLLLQHAEIATTQETYRQYVLPDVLVEMSSKSSISRELMIGLWSFFRRFLGSYSVDNDTPAISTPTTAQRSPRLTNLKMHLNLYGFLNRCNTPEVEPSQAQRLANYRRLKEAVNRIDPSSSMGLLAPV